MQKKRRPMSDRKLTEWDFDIPRDNRFHDPFAHMDEVTTAEERLKEIEALIPTSFYAGATLTRRVERLVSNWKHMVKVMHAVENEDQRVAELKRLFETAEAYFLETGRSFWALDPVLQKNLIEGRCVS